MSTSLTNMLLHRLYYFALSLTCSLMQLTIWHLDAVVTEKFAKSWQLRDCIST